MVATSVGIICDFCPLSPSFDADELCDESWGLSGEKMPDSIEDIDNTGETGSRENEVVRAAEGAQQLGGCTHFCLSGPASLQPCCAD